VKIPDVIVCGAGVIGCAIARELAAEGVAVTVLDRGRAGGEASGAAAGLLTGQADFDEDSAFARLCRESALGFAAFAEAVALESGIPVHHRTCGSLRFASGAPDAARMARIEKWQKSAAWPVERVSGRRLEEIAGRDFPSGARDALYFAEEAIVDNVALVAALRLSAERRGARFRTETAALGVRIGDGACRGVSTTGGDLAAGAVIDAAGSWAGFDPALPFPVPVRPIRGQIVELAAVGGPPARIVHGGGFYVAPRERGRILVGATVEEAGYDKTVTAEAVKGLIERGGALVPRLAEASVVAAWAGLRPMAPDGLPILGTTPLRGFLLATGHFRNGILLSPVTARLLSDVVLGRPTALDLAPYAVGRFSDERAGRPAQARRLYTKKRVLVR